MSKPPKYTGPSPEYKANDRAFKDALQGDHLDHTTRQAYADWLRDQGYDDKAEFQQEMAGWLKDGYLKAKAKGSEWSIRADTEHLPGGMSNEHLNGYLHRIRANAKGRDWPHVPRVRDGAFHWLDYHSMETALSNAFSAHQTIQKLPHLAHLFS